MFGSYFHDLRMKNELSKNNCTNACSQSNKHICPLILFHSYNLDLAIAKCLMIALVVTAVLHHVGHNILMDQKFQPFEKPTPSIQKIIKINIKSNISFIFVVAPYLLTESKILAMGLYCVGYLFKGQKRTGDIIKLLYFASFLVQSLLQYVLISRIFVKILTYHMSACKILKCYLSVCVYGSELAEIL